MRRGWLFFERDSGEVLEIFAEIFERDDFSGDLGAAADCLLAGRGNSDNGAGPSLVDGDEEEVGEISAGGADACCLGFFSRGR